LFQKIADGWTIAQWVRYANANGIPTKNPSRGWIVQNVSKLLRSEEYVGKGSFGKGSAKGTVPLKYPVIISKDLFNRVQENFACKRKVPRGSTTATYPLQHLGRCGVCGSRLGLVTYKKRLRYIYCLGQKTYPHINNCFEPKMKNLTLVEDAIWDEVESVLLSYKDKTTDFLLRRSENAQAGREEQLAKVKDEISRCDLEKQRIIHQLRKGVLTDSDIDLSMRAIKSDKERWESELLNLEELGKNSDLVWNRFFEQLDKLQKYWLLGFEFTTTPEQKKELLNLLLDEFIMRNDGKVELRFKLPVNEEQVAERICTSSARVLTTN
jgi:hypothetical protein